ncbi:MarR family transcriptional regulator [Streptococcus dentasini]
MANNLLNLSQELQIFVEKYKRLEQEQHHIPDRDLTMVEVHLLVLVGQERGIGLSQIAKKRQISRSAVTQLVNKLVLKGYLQKKLSPHKKSSYGLILTELGQEIYQLHLYQHEFLRKKLEEVLAVYPEHFLEEVRQLMSEVEGVWDALVKKNREGWNNGD